MWQEKRAIVYYFSTSKKTYKGVEKGHLARRYEYTPYTSPEATHRYTKLLPACRSSRFSIHGYYWRKGFHLDPRGSKFTQRVQIPRYLCLNPECQISTFSHLPPIVLRFCRFFWPDLLSFIKTPATKDASIELARVWQVGRNVIRRVLLLLDKLTSWITTVHQEVTDGSPAQPLQRMVQTMLAKLEWSQLWYRGCKHRYPGRFFTKPDTLRD